MSRMNTNSDAGVTWVGGRWSTRRTCACVASGVGNKTTNAPQPSVRAPSSRASTPQPW